jgi:Rrf2 family protein
MTILNIATHQGDGYVGLSFLAKLQDLSPGMLEKTMRLLMHAQLLEAFRGPGGGYRLSRPPSQISLAEVYAAVSGKFELSPCLENSDCPGCQLKTTWKKVSDLIWLKLQSVTLDNLGDGCVYTNHLHPAGLALQQKQ